MIKVLYKDKHIIVCEKPVNILSEHQSNTLRTMPDIIKKMTGAYRVDVVHRLDKMVGGTMVYSLNSRATKGLSETIKNHRMVKEYLAVVHGAPEPKMGEMRDYLFKDSAKNKSFVVKTLRKGAKEALLEYELIETLQTEKGKISLVKIRLHTGRTHQIRVQFSSRKMPLLGDGKYGSHDNGCFIALWSHHLSFRHPTANKQVEEFSLPPKKDYPWRLFGKVLNSIAVKTQKPSEEAPEKAPNQS